MKYLQKRLSVQVAQWLSIMSLCMSMSTLSAQNAPNVPVTALTSNGDRIAVWEVDPSSGNDYIQASTRPAGGSWQTSVTLSNTSHQAQTPVIASNSHGDTVVAWTVLDTTLGVYRITTTMLSSVTTNSWATPIIISTSNDSTFGNFQLTINDSGHIALVWTSYNQTTGNIDLWHSTAKIGDTSWTTVSLS